MLLVLLVLLGLEQDNAASDALDGNALLFAVLGNLDFMPEMGSEFLCVFNGLGRARED